MKIKLWRLWCSCIFGFGLSSITIYTLLVRYGIKSPPNFFRTSEEFEGFDNVNGTADGCYIVPNIIHFIRLDQPIFSFTEAVCVLAALKNQRPDKIYFHTNSKKFVGRYWDVIMSTPGAKDVIELMGTTKPDQIFGQNFSTGWKNWHVSDIKRLEILMRYGGIYLDNDSYIVKSLNKFRVFEMAVSWQYSLWYMINNQAIIAHKNARFLREWMLTYKDHYDRNKWYFNAGFRPVEVVLSKRPELVHRVGRRFVEYPDIPAMLYLDYSGIWRDHYAIHLYINHLKFLVPGNLSSSATYPVVFNETNIHKYHANFRDMVYDVYPFKPNNSFTSNITISSPKMYE